MTSLLAGTAASGIGAASFDRRYNGKPGCNEIGGGPKNLKKD